MSIDSRQIGSPNSGECWIPAKDFPAEMERRGFSPKRGTGGYAFASELNCDLVSSHHAGARPTARATARST